ncbi:MAG: glycosyltransferase [Halieaceae bacterium]|nr:glycosyltransferase [Halieaceae bacterium]
MNADTVSPRVCFIQFSRAPVPGRVKTRLLPSLSPQQACDLHCELTQWTAAQLVNCGLGEVELSVAGGLDFPLFESCRQRGVSRLSRQRGKDLGERMFHALHERLAHFDCVILVGSDCPSIDADYLRQAIVALEDAPVVLGPALDGGYVLIGARCVKESMFRNIPWGTERVLACTRVALRRAGLAFTELNALADIDRPEDIHLWLAISQGVGANASK